MKIENLTMNLKVMGIERIKKRRSFDDIFKERKTCIDKMSLKELKEHREYLKTWLYNTEELRREDKITQGRKMYLSGLRKVVINLLNHSKYRIKTINTVVHNGTSIAHAKRFIMHAADILLQETFQTIYGLSLAEEEKDQMTIESVKIFMHKSEIIAKSEANGNIL